MAKIWSTGEGGVSRMSFVFPIVGMELNICSCLGFETEKMPGSSSPQRTKKKLPRLLLLLLNLIKISRYACIK